jgi:hypothetical protein
VDFNSSVFHESGEGKHGWIESQNKVRGANAGTTGKEKDLIRNQNMRFDPLSEASNCVAFSRAKVHLTTQSVVIS